MIKDEQVVDVDNSKPFRAGGFDKLSRDECEILVLNTLLQTAKGDINLVAEDLGLDEVTLAKNLRRHAAL